MWVRTLIWPLFCKGQRPWRIALQQQETDKRARWRWSCTLLIYAAPCTATESSSTLLSYSLPFGLGSAIVSYTATYWAKLHPPDLRSTLQRCTAPYCAEVAIFWAKLHHQSLALSKWVQCALVLLNYTAPYWTTLRTSGLQSTLLSYYATSGLKYWPATYPLEIRCTLLCYAVPCWTTLHPPKLLFTLWVTLHPSDLRRTLRRHDASYLAEVAPSGATPSAEVAPF